MANKRQRKKNFKKWIKSLNINSIEFTDPEKVNIGIYYYNNNISKYSK